MNRLEAIRAGLSKNYPMYWTGPRYQVPDADLRDLLAVAEAAVELCTGSMVPEVWIENKRRLEAAVEKLTEDKDGTD